MKKQISVVVPIYNASRTLNLLLKSILKQTLNKKKYELILINDGSTDNSEQIIREFIKKNKKEFKIKYKKQKHQGRTYSRNQGVKLSEGKFILSLDSDQELSEGLLEECLYYAKNKDFSVIAIPEIGTGKNLISKFIGYERKINFYKTKRDIPRFYAKKIIEEVGFWNPKLCFNEDFDVYQRALLKGYKMAIIEKNFIKHHEIDTLKSLIKKYFNYGKNSPQILKLHSKSAYKMYLCMNKQLLYNILYFFVKNPLMWIGAMFIKFIRYGFTFVGLIYGKIK